MRSRRRCRHRIRPVRYSLVERDNHRLGGMSSWLVGGGWVESRRWLESNGSIPAKSRIRLVGCWRHGIRDRVVRLRSRSLAMRPRTGADLLVVILRRRYRTMRLRTSLPI